MRCRPFTISTAWLFPPIPCAKVQDRGVQADVGPAHIRDLQILDGGASPARLLPTQPLTFRLTVDCDCRWTTRPLWIKFTRSDGMMATSWLSHEPEFHDIGLLPAGRQRDRTGGGRPACWATASTTSPWRSSRSGRAAASRPIYADPMTIWEKTHRIEVKRRGRPFVRSLISPCGSARSAAARRRRFRRRRTMFLPGARRHGNSAKFPCPIKHRTPGAWVPLLACPAVSDHHTPQHCWTSQQWHPARLDKPGTTRSVVLAPVLPPFGEKSPSSRA